MENNPDYGLSGVEYMYIINENGDFINKKEHKLGYEEISKIILQSNEFSHSSVIIRKSVLDEVGIYDPKYYCAQDYDLWLRIGKKYKFNNLENVSISYRINQKGISVNNKRKQQLTMLKSCIKYRKYYPNFFSSLIIRIIRLVGLEDFFMKIRHFCKTKVFKK